MTKHHYNETYRPQFHFSAQTGWLNDPNGLVYCNGRYHLFFQHNPFGTNWGNMTWGHAVSSDLVHWRQLDNAIEPDRLGTIFSGTAVVDWNNTAGFGREAIIAFYTAAGHHVEPKAPYTQCLACSKDGGNTFTKYSGNPILGEIAPGNRDPKVFWHGPTERWIMALYLEAEGVHTIQFFTSRNLIEWEYQSRIEGFYECPDLFRLGDEWVLFGASGHYMLGDFDGSAYFPHSGKHINDFGSNFYAAQTYNDIPASDGRRILIGWMRGGQYPHMPFNQQMTVPCEMTLRNGRLCKWPVHELESLRHSSGERLDTEAELLDIEAEIEPGRVVDCGFDVRGLTVCYLPADGLLLVEGAAMPLPLVNGRIRLRLLIDRTSVEIFGNDGSTVCSKCHLPRTSRQPVRFFAHGQARLTELRVHELDSAWIVE